MCNQNVLMLVLKALVLLTVVMFQYGQTYQFDYAYDDTIFITENDRVKAGLSDLNSFFVNARTGELQHKTGYRPITLLSFATEVQFFGLSPGVSHCVNHLFYWLLCLLLWLLLSQIMFPNKWVPYATVLIFASHPLHVEVVANIKGRDELLSMLFGLSFLLLHLKYLKSAKWWILIFAPILLLLSFTSKESGVVYGLLAACLCWVLPSVKLLKRLASFLWSIFSTGSVVGLYYFVHSSSFYVDKYDQLAERGVFHWDGFLGNPLFDIESWAIKFATACKIIAFSVAKFTYPVNLVHDYSYNEFEVAEWGNSEPYIGLTLTVCALFALVWAHKKHKLALVVGVVWFFTTISVYLSLLRPATDIFAERYLFTPTVGLSLALVSLILLVRNKLIQILAVCVVVLFMSIQSNSRTQAWENTETLLEADIEKLDQCVRANYNYALLLHKRYLSDTVFQSIGLRDSILFHYERAYGLTNRLPNLFIAMGKAYMEFDNPENAKKVFSEAMQLNPGLIGPPSELSKLHLVLGEYDSAVYYLDRVLVIDSLNQDNHYLLGVAYSGAKNYTAALRSFTDGFSLGTPSISYMQSYIATSLLADSIEFAQELANQAVELYPEDSVIVNYSSVISRVRKSALTTGNKSSYREIYKDEDDQLREMIDRGLAIHKRYAQLTEREKRVAEQEILKEYHAAIKLNDTLPNLYVALGSAYMQFGKQREALVVFREMIDKLPDNPDSWSQMGHFMVSVNERDSAQIYYDKSVELESQDESAYRILASIYNEQGDLSKALQILQIGEVRTEPEVLYYQYYARLCLQKGDRFFARSIVAKGLDKYPQNKNLLQLKSQL